MALFRFWTGASVGFLLVWVWISGGFTPLSAAQIESPSSNVRLNNWIYPALEKLAAEGLIITDLWGTRPFTRAEVAALLAEARLRLEAFQEEGKTFAPGIQDILQDLADTTRQYEDKRKTPYYFHTLQNPRLQFLYRDGNKSFFPAPGLQASQFSLTYNNEGIKLEQGGNALLSFEAEGGIGPLSLYLQPLFSVGDETASAVLHQGYLKFRMAGLELEAGKDSLWWGQGYHGGLFLTNNADPLKLIRLTNPSPALLPWIFKYIGPIRFDFFVSQLEEDRVVSEPIFTGLRINFKPHPVFEFGLTRTIIMFGEGRPEFSFKRLWEILFGDNKEQDEDLSNSIAGIDFRFNLPFVQLYAEVGGEDEAGLLPTEKAYLAGLYLPSLGPGFGQDLNFRVEYARLNRVWYRHGVYRSGYTYRRRFLGHHVGGGGRDLFFELGLLRGRELSGKLNFDYEERGIDIEPVTEKHHQIGTEWEGTWDTRIGNTLLSWSTNIGLAYDRIIDADYIAGRNRNNFLFQLGIQLHR